MLVQVAHVGGLPKIMEAMDELTEAALALWPRTSDGRQTGLESLIGG